jgi:hypothetical protein
MIGRNALCPCGSGDKVKRCCGVEAAEQMLRDREAPASGLSRTFVMKNFRPLINKIEGFQAHRLGREGALRASDLFFSYLEIGPQDMEPYFDVFGHFFLFVYKRSMLPPNTPGHSGKLSANELTGAEAFRAAQFTKLSSGEQELLEALLTAHLSFWEITSISNGTHIEIHDLFSDKVITVEDHGLASSVRLGHIIFGSFIFFRGEHHTALVGQILLPPFYKITVLDAYEEMFEPDPDFEFTAEEDILELMSLYIEFANDVLNPPPPQLCNTDGDQLEFGEVTFKTNLAPRVVAEKLSVLNSDGVKSINKLKDGSLSLPWVRENKKGAAMDTTIVANFKISEGVVIAEVNSRERAKALRAKVKELFGDLCKYSKTRYSEPPTPESLKASAGQSPAVNPHSLENIPPEFRAEVIEKIRAHMDGMSRNWVDQKIPMLGGKTPRECMGNPHDAKRVEALLDSFELARNQSPSKDDPNAMGLNIELIRQMLGL